MLNGSDLFDRTPDPGFGVMIEVSEFLSNIEASEYEKYSSTPLHAIGVASSPLETGISCFPAGSG